MSHLSRLVARAAPWRKTPARSADQPEGQHAQPLPLWAEDQRRALNLKQFNRGLRHLVGSSIAALLAGAATSGLLWLGWQTPSPREAAFFVGFAVFSGFTTAVMLLSARDISHMLFGIYSNAYFRAEDATDDNARLRRQIMRLMTERVERVEGEAGRAGGNALPASNLRFIRPRRETH